ncbi:MAG: bifunctional 5,10-methylenetetrahydrofolate dehydrogenase/5,10-methenyltetrahydrofolate cyclohydrolase [Thermoleophilia bacterium]|nr:bifunctional 5,10-methylenetetrahydrofolate dehydrogenase/5,10-methenyltetrahydrofolate cyclohydrolase [Thermoleophilia bacterium]
MTAELMEGRPLAERIRRDVAAEAAEVGSVALATVLVGDDAASEVYIRLKHRAAEEAGIAAIDHRLPADAAEEDVLDLVAELNDDDAVDGVLVQTPLPAHIDEATVMRAIDPMKDVDGLHPVNAGQLFLGRPTLVGATPLGIMRLLEEHGVGLAGRRAVVVGRSLIVGKPVAMLLLQANATVTVCHSRTADLAAETRAADVLVAATGQAGMIRAEMVKPGAAVVDVGITRTEAGLVGDVDPEVARVAGLLTPVPGGVGPMTIALLLANAVRAARYRRGVLAFPRG